MVVIIDYGMGNVRSVEKACKRIRTDVCISNDLEVINSASKLILPGVGHFTNGVKKLRETGIWDVIQRKAISDKTPILGICLGMQLMTISSEEGNVNGFGWLQAITKKFNLESDLKVPHMGWNTLKSEKKSILLEKISHESEFYFVHSYYVECANESDVLFRTTYGIDFVSGFQKDNIFGVQFHPEKSHQSGLVMINNFIK